LAKWGLNFLPHTLTYTGTSLLKYCEHQEREQQEQEQEEREQEEQE